MLDTTRKRLVGALSIIAVAATVCFTVGCGTLYSMFGYPPEPLRKTEPVGIRGTALKVGVDAPFFTLDSSTGKRVSLGDVVKAGPTVVLFYRGHW